MIELSEVFNQPGAGFTPIKPGLKFPPMINEWQKSENAYTFEEAAAHVRRGGNIGILAGIGQRLGLDKDNLNAFEGLELPKTTTWETRPGRLGFSFTCSNRSPEVLAKYGVKAGQAQIKLFKDGRLVGEVKLERTYQVIPPSHKFIDAKTGDDVPPKDGGQQVDYKLLDSSQPAEISLDWLLSELQRIGISFKQPKKDKGKLKKVNANKSRERLYVEAALRDEISILANTGEGSHNRNNQLNTSAFNLGQFVGAGDLSEAEVIEELSKAAEDTGLTPDEIERTTKSGLESGKKLPRRIPEEQPLPPIMYEKISDYPCAIIELLATFKKWLYIGEDYNIIGAAAGILANFCPGDPDIIGIVGPSGSTKTEIIRSLGETQNQFVYPVSSITEHTLVSGHKNSKDIIPQLQGRLLAIKDFTSILAKDEKVRSQIFADFRDFTDGYLRKEWGNGISKEYKNIHSSILFASTNQIERYYSMHASLGQRIIFLRPKNDSEKSRGAGFSKSRKTGRNEK